MASDSGSVSSTAAVEHPERNANAIVIVRKSARTFFMIVSSCFVFIFLKKPFGESMHRLQQNKRRAVSARRGQIVFAGTLYNFISFLKVYRFHFCHYKA